jgi:hypothetical protein
MNPGTMIGGKHQLEPTLATDVCVFAIQISKRYMILPTLNNQTLLMVELREY